MINKKIAQIVNVSLEPNSGMGRVAVHWRDALVRRGWIFKHYGSKEVPKPFIKPLWAYSARKKWNKSRSSENILLAHEPVAGILRKTGVPTVLFSHGLEEREKDIVFCNDDFSNRFSSVVTHPFWRHLARQRELALQKCPLLLLINQDDKNFVISKYGRRPEDIFVFRNGVNSSSLKSHQVSSNQATVLFYGSWLERKGKSVLIKAAKKLAQAGIKPRWLLVGTGILEADVLLDWPKNLHPNVKVVSNVPSENEDNIYNQATVFVLPSYYEGQPLTLLQAMECGRCVITTRCCGQKDIIKTNHNGFLFDPGDDEQLASLIAKALENNDLRIKVGCQAKLDMAFRGWKNVSDEVVDRLDQFNSGFYF